MCNNDTDSTKKNDLNSKNYILCIEMIFEDFTANFQTDFLLIY